LRLITSNDQSDAIVKGRLQQAWQSVEPVVFGLTLPLMSEHLCEDLDLQPADRVLDVAAGCGSATLSAARRGCDVVSSDFVEQMLELARRRADAEDLPISFRLADVEALPFVNQQFDSVLSTFGVSCSPNPGQAAHELLRVCRTGGRIGLLHWSSSSLIAEMFCGLSATSRHDPLLESLMFWGNEARVRELFEPLVEELVIDYRKYKLRFRTFDHFQSAFLFDYAPKGVYFDRSDLQMRDLLQSWRRRCRKFNLGIEPALVFAVDVLQIRIVR